LDKDLITYLRKNYFKFTSKNQAKIPLKELEKWAKNPASLDKY